MLCCVVWYHLVWSGEVLNCLVLLCKVWPGLVRCGVILWNVVLPSVIVCDFVLFGVVRSVEVFGGGVWCMVDSGQVCLCVVCCDLVWSGLVVFSAEGVVWCSLIWLGVDCWVGVVKRGGGDRLLARIRGERGESSS